MAPLGSAVTVVNTAAPLASNSAYLVERIVDFSPALVENQSNSLSSSLSVIFFDSLFFSTS